MKTVIVKLNFDLMWEIIREALIDILATETDRDSYTCLYTADGNSGLYAFGASVYAETIEDSKAFTAKWEGVETADELLKNVSGYNDFVFIRADRRTLLRFLKEHLEIIPVKGMPKSKYVADINIFGETEEELRCTAVLTSKETENSIISAEQADAISEFSDADFNGVYGVTKIN